MSHVAPPHPLARAAAPRPEPSPPIESSDAPHKSRGNWRSLCDVALCLYIAVILFRTFEIEGYIISTGSMAPSLLGFHKRVVCPSCGHEFAYGIAVDANGTGADSTESETSAGPGEVRCPNCGEDRIDARFVPPNHGDQLLVQKDAYDFRSPRRWEVVVLKGPTRPTPPFVKRIVGLPNESLQIQDGDIYVNGEICRKSLAQQHAMRIPVYDNDEPPTDLSGAQQCWIIESPNTGWRSAGHGFEYRRHAEITAENADAAARPPLRNAHPNPVAGESPAAEGRAFSWVSFRRWVRHGGRFETEVRLSGAKSLVRVPRNQSQVRFNETEGTLQCTGALEPALRDRLLSLNSASLVQTAIDELFARSHEGPVTDDYGYNRSHNGLNSLPVRDICLECDVTIKFGEGEVALELGDSRETFRLTFDRGKKEVRLALIGHPTLLRQAPLPASTLGKQFRLEISQFDRQVLAAVDGVLLFPAWECPPDRPEPSRVPLKIGARDVEVELTHLRVYRDIYYTRGLGRNASDRPIVLGPDEYFALGDNSPVSNDSRNWIQGAVKQSQLIGKPLIVHLPSRPGRFGWGDHVRHIRIPDFSRIRYIR